MKPTMKEKVLNIFYDSWTDDITVKGRQIHHVQTRYEYDNPVSAVPSRQYEVELTAAELTDRQLEGLQQLIQASGFETLADTYGAPEGSRFYPYRLTIEWGDTRKEVLYRSNPSYEGPPAAFREIERYLFDCSEEARSPALGALRIVYDSWSDDITVEAKHLRHVETQYVFDNPVSSVPSRWQEVVVTDADVPDHEWTALEHFIRNSGFERLAESYGAPEGSRYYPYNLSIAWGDTVKEVRYRQNPSYDEPPESFKAIERYLKALSERLRE
jgi:hypothetical protein